MSLLWKTATEGEYVFGHEQVDDADEDLGLPATHLVTAHHRGEPVGHLPYIHSRDGKRLLMNGDMWVDPAHRRKGVATGMVNHLKGMHPDKEIDPQEFTHDGEAFWRSLG